VLDLVLVVVSVAFFVATWAYVQGAERM